jgi:S1-C subfamily serine protease
MRSGVHLKLRPGFAALALALTTATTMAFGSDVRTASGFAVTADGFAVTSAHVVEGCRDIMVAHHGVARIVRIDRNNDLALIKLNTKGLLPAAIRTSAPKLGETVYALGFPLAERLDNTLNFTSGLVSALAGLENDRRALQFTAPIQPGNSGGPLVDDSGALIGIVRSKLGDADLLRTKGVTAQNISFAVRAQHVLALMSDAGVQAREVNVTKPRLAVDVAEMGTHFTLQVLCTPEQRTATRPML